ncbi:MAG: CooT family nickel-binding protein [Deltaproteobacteria bacterium]|nr:CooT family nickel-binding protein [Candidatus Anaeroferrophillus wilburensis]MBN2890030.1 CooT family nickel-binding protein [Deltaproteobacteria bacterium]
MCQSNAFLIKENGTEEMVMENVSLITPLEDGSLELTGLFGERLNVKATIKEMDLLKHRILIQED